MVWRDNFPRKKRASVRVFFSAVKNWDCFRYSRSKNVLKHLSMNDIGYQIFKNMFFRYFSTCSNWANFHNELVFLNDIFLKNVYPISFIDKCFKTVFDRLYLKRPQVLTAKKNTLTLVLPFLRKFSLQTRTRLQKVFKRTLSCSQI